MRNISILFSLVVAACGGKSSVDTGTVAAENEAPRVAISAPADGSTYEEGAEITIFASASDDRDESTVLALTWESTVDGDLEGPNASVDGTVVFSPELSVGTHTITLTARDTGALQASDSVLIKVTSTGDDDGGTDGGTGADSTDGSDADADGAADADSGTGAGTGGAMGGGTGGWGFDTGFWGGFDTGLFADLDLDFDGGDDEPPTMEDYTTCTHPYDPVDVPGWTKTYNAVFLDRPATAVESYGGKLTGWGSDLLTVFVRSESLVQDDERVWSGDTFIGCGVGDVSGMFTLGWTHEISIDVESPDLGEVEIADVFDFSHTEPRMYLHEEAIIALGGSWDFEYDMAYPAGSSGVAALFSVPVSGTNTSVGIETIEVLGTTYEAWRIDSEYTMELTTTEVFTHDYVAEATFWYAEGIGLVKEEHKDTRTGSTILKKELISIEWEDVADDLDGGADDADVDGGEEDDTGVEDTGDSDTEDTGLTDDESSTTTGGTSDATTGGGTEPTTTGGGTEPTTTGGGTEPTTTGDATTGGGTEPTTTGGGTEPTTTGGGTESTTTGDATTGGGTEPTTTGGGTEPTTTGDATTGGSTDSATTGGGTEPTTTGDATTGGSTDSATTGGGTEPATTGDATTGGSTEPTTTGGTTPATTTGT